MYNNFRNTDLEGGCLPKAMQDLEAAKASPDRSWTVGVQLVLWILLAAAGCRNSNPDHSIYDRMFRESRERVMFVGNEQAATDALDMLKYAEKNGSRYGKVMAYLSLTSLAAQRADFDNMSRYMEVARASLDYNDPSFLQGYAYFVEGTVNFSTSLSLNSLLCYDKALHYFRPIGDSLMIASCYINKFNCYSINGDMEAATASLDSARCWAPASYQLNIRLYTAMLLNYQGHAQEAVRAYEKLVQDARADSSSPSYPSSSSARFWSLLYSNYIFALLNADKVPEAEIQCARMEETAVANGTAFDTTIQRLMTAWVAFRQENLDKALEICTDIYEHYQSDHTLTIQRQALDLMVQCFTKKEDYRNAFEYGHILSSLVTDQKVNAHLIEEIIERQQKYESHIHELEIGRVRARIWLLLVAFLLTVTIVGFMLYHKERRLKERHARVRELEQEKELARQQREIDTARMDHVATREQMDNFALEMRRIASDMPKNLRIKLLQGIHRMEERREQDVWDNFESSFTRQHAGFLERLNQQYPSLSPIEVKIAMLLRMGLTNKEIADTLHIADNTVRTYRTRMRRKFQLTDKEDLNTFIASL